MTSNQHDEMYVIYEAIQTLMNYHSELGQIVKNIESNHGKDDNLSQIELCSSAILEICDKIETSFDKNVSHCCCCHQN